MKFVEELAETLENLSIDRNDICIIGSAILGRVGLREPRDLDIVVKSEIREKLGVRGKPYQPGFKLSENIDIQVEWGAAVGLPDDILISDDSFHEEYIGFKFMRMEIHFAIAFARRRQTDLRDIDIYQKKILYDQHWDWGLIDTILAKSSLSLTEIGPVTTRKMLRGTEFSPSPQKSVSLFLTNRLIPFVLHKVRNYLSSSKGAIMYYSSYFFTSKIFSQDYSRPLKSVEVQTSSFMHPGSILSRHFSRGEFTRFDIVIRCMVVDSIINEKTEYFEEYKRMQFLRVGNFGLDNIPTLTNLVESMQESGFNESNRLQLTRDGRLSNHSGAHRLACSMVLGIEKIPVSFIPTVEKPIFNESWFIENGFSESFVKEMHLYLEKLLNNQGLRTIVILWPDTKDLRDEMEEFVSSKYNIVESRKFTLNRADFTDFVREVYGIDDVDPWKAEYKIFRMAQERNDIEILLVDSTTTKFRQKALTKSYLSVDGEKMKLLIRNKFSDKIDRYFFDNIVHTGDNHIQNSRLYRAIDSYSKSPQSRRTDY